MSDLLSYGGRPPHVCEPPNVSLMYHHGAIWRCGCGKRWRLHVRTVSPGRSWMGSWRRYHWPWPRGSS